MWWGSDAAGCCQAEEGVEKLRVRGCEAPQPILGMSAPYPEAKPCGWDSGRFPERHQPSATLLRKGAAWDMEEERTGGFIL